MLLKCKRRTKYMHKLSWSENIDICILGCQLEFGYLKTEQNQSELVVWFGLFNVQIFSWSRSFVGDEGPGNVIFCVILFPSVWKLISVSGSKLP